MPYRPIVVISTLSMLASPALAQEGAQPTPADAAASAPSGQPTTPPSPKPAPAPPPGDPASPPGDPAPPPADPASPPADPASPPADPPQPPDLEPIPDARVGRAWALYNEAFQAAIANDWERVSALAEQLRREHPDHPATAKVATVDEMSRARRGVNTTPGDATDTGPGPDAAATWPAAASNGAKAELALVQTLNGIAIGIELCVAADCDSGVAFTLWPLLTGTLGLTASLGMIGDVHPGQRAGINSGTLWGAYNAIMLAIVSDTIDNEASAAAIAAGQLGGAFGGYALWKSLRLTSGDIATANTVGMWSSLLTFMLIESLGRDSVSDGSLTAILVAGDIGLVAGGYLARRFSGISRGRMLLIDAGGIVGGLGGLASAVLIKGDEISAEASALGALLGATAGLAGMAYLSRKWDRALGRFGKSSRMTLLPARGGGFTAGLQFDLDL